MNLTNETYIKLTTKGGKALLQDPPIPFKIRSLLHQMPKLGSKDFFEDNELLKISDLYVSTNSNDPIGFLKLINELFDKDWIAVVEEHEKSPKESQELENDDSNIFKNIPSHDEEDFIDENTSEVFVPEEKSSIIKDTESKNDNIEEDKSSSEHFTDVSRGIEKWVEDNEIEENESIEIPWNNPFMTLEDYLASDNPEKAYEEPKKEPIKREFIREQNVGAPDFVTDKWDNPVSDEPSSVSKTKDEKFKEQMDLMKAEQRRKDKNNSSTNSTKTSKSYTKKTNKNTKKSGFMGFLNKFFGNKK